jgi:hypothetical protein
MARSIVRVLFNRRPRKRRVPGTRSKLSVRADVCVGPHHLPRPSTIPAESFARAVAFAIGQPDDVDINEILFRPTRQEL